MSSADVEVGRGGDLGRRSGRGGSSSADIAATGSASLANTASLTSSVAPVQDSVYHEHSSSVDDDDVDMGYEDHGPSSALRTLQHQQLQVSAAATPAPVPVATTTTSASASEPAAADSRRSGTASSSPLPTVNHATTFSRRGSMTAVEQQERRANIKAILANPSMSPLTKRRSIQYLMDGRRHSFTSSSNMSVNDEEQQLHQQEHQARRRSSCNTCTSPINGSGNSSSGFVTPDTLSDTDESLQQQQQQQQPEQQQQQQLDQEEPEPRLAGFVSEDDESSPHVSKVGTTTANGTGVVLRNNNAASRRAEETRPPCPHYTRNCTLIAPCCGAAFGCRICHDDCPVLPAVKRLDSDEDDNGATRSYSTGATGVSSRRQRIRRYPRSSSMPLCGGGSSSNSSTSSCCSTTRSDDDDGDDYRHRYSPHPEDTHHNIDRFAIKEVICRECYTRQSSKTNHCLHCGIQFGEYHCNICNLWMSAEESPYHCQECGFCRVGGAHNFQHCADCGMCIDKSLYDNHNCKSGKYKSNCPVCQEYLFSSRSASHEMPCGHAIHWDCFRQLAAHDSRCPVCKKTAETKERMMPAWRAMAASIAMQPLTPDLARVVDITCNDCEEACTGRAWHFLGVQCHSCSSFNTVVDRLALSGEEAYRYLQANSQLLLEAPPLPSLPPLLAHSVTTTVANDVGIRNTTIAAVATPRRTSPDAGAIRPQPRRRQHRVNRRRSLL